MSIKGYKSENGNYITIAEQKKRRRKMSKQSKIENVAHQAKLNRELEYSRILYIQERQDQKDLQNDIDKRATQSKDFLDHVAENYDYNTFMIGYDIVNGSTYELMHGINKGRITLGQVQDVYNVACTMIRDILFSMDVLV